jgi:hypothetical protein
MFELYPTPMLITALAVAAALILGYVLARYLARREHAMLVKAEREIGAVLKAPGLRLSDVPAELREFEKLMNKFSSEKFELEQRSQALHSQLMQADPGPDMRRAIALSDCLTDTAKSAEDLANVDPDFALVGRTLDLVSGLRRSADALKGLSRGPSFAAQLARLLDQGDLDVPLTVSAILEKYFSERSSWREICISARAADALLVSLLDRVGVRIVDVPILSIIDSADARDMQLSDRRELRSIPAIQQKAARIARELHPNELLVVDCHRPGWISDQLGSRAPHLAIFDPASWT